jgi:hypothetical protein
MRTSAPIKPNATHALRQTAKILGVTDTARLRTALLCAAADEITRSSAFRSQVSELYQAVASTPVPPPVAKWAQLVPLNPNADESIDLFAPPDPYWILRVYGAAQLPQALEMFPLSSLKEASSQVELRHPGSKPRNRGRKADVISYIVEHVAGNRA